MNKTTCQLAAVMLGLVVCCVVQGDSRDPCCAGCGVGSCHKVCRLVKEEKSVEVICWGAKVEEFCVPGPSCPGCVHCECVECTDPKGEICTHPGKFVWREWLPSECAKIFTRKKLMKKVVTKKVPSYKWVVEDLCEPCEAQLQKVALEPGAEIPAPPRVPGANVVGADVPAVKK